MEITYNRTVTVREINTVGDLERACRDFGSHYMDADTLRYFGCRVLDVRPLGDGVAIMHQTIKGGFDHASGRVHKVTRFTFTDEGLQIDDLYNGLKDRGCASQGRKALAIYKSAR